MKRHLCLVICLCVASVHSADAAEMQSRKEPQAVAAPTQPVATKPLDAPAFESDTKTIQAIVNKVDDAPVSAVAAPVAKEPVMPPAAKETKTTIPAVKRLPAQGTAASREVVMVKPSVSVVSGGAIDVGDAKTEKALEDEDAPKMMLTGMRIFAIRWYEVLVVAFLGAIAWFTGLLYRASYRQNSLLARTAQAAEEAARAAQRSTLMTEKLFAKLDMPDERQVSLELD